MTASLATDPLFDPAVAHFVALQDRIMAALEAFDGKTFLHDDWTRDDHNHDENSPVLDGWGRTRVLENGHFFEKAGVNFSCVHGRFTPGFAATMPGDGLEFHATGVSLVLHPRNPHVPTVHMNYRRLSRGGSGWFGGGADLTPYYFDAQDAVHFHRTHRQACETFEDIVDWPKLKQACDAYFFLPHRSEQRGIGGIFFDHLSQQPERTWQFVQSAADAFLPAYLPIAARHRDEAVTEAQRQWQLIRRGRYVEFNLVHDRGTLFGLKTNGRIESILMSLPNLVAWQYNHQPDVGSPEARLLRVLRQGLDIDSIM